MRALPAVLALAFLPCVSVPAAAQQELLQPGVRIRLPQQGEGLIAHRRADTIVVVLKAGTPVVLPVSSLRTVQVRGDRDRVAGAVRGALWGGGFGAVMGVAMWAAGDSTGCRHIDVDAWRQYDCTRTFGAGDALLTSVSSVMVGAGIGALIGRRQWYTIDVGSGVALEALPGRGLRVSVRRRRQGRAGRRHGLRGEGQGRGGRIPA